MLLLCPEAVWLGSSKAGTGGIGDSEVSARALLVFRCQDLSYGTVAVQPPSADLLLQNKISMNFPLFAAKIHLHPYEHPID